MDSIETSWGDIPELFNFTAVDENGRKYAYSGKPVRFSHMWLGDDAQYLGFVFGARKGEWKDSLRERKED